MFTAYITHGLKVTREQAFRTVDGRALGEEEGRTLNMKIKTHFRVMRVNQSSKPRTTAPSIEDRFKCMKMMMTQFFIALFEMNL